MKNITEYIETVGEIISLLDKEGFEPTLIGGMALVILGSQRVTKNFDFLIREEARQTKNLIKIFYQQQFELASKLNESGEIINTIDNQTVARIRLESDKPDSAYFYNKKTGLRIDLLFDFPLPANEIASRAETKKIKSYNFRIASKEDLLNLKKIAHKNRKLATDKQDIEFLKTKLALK